MIPASPTGAIVLCATLVAFSVLVLIARFFVRYIHNERFRLDDWTTALTVICIIAMGVSYTKGAYTGELNMSQLLKNGTDSTNPDAESQYTDLGNTYMNLFIFNILQIVALGAVKLSVLLYLHRCFKKLNHRFVNWYLWVLIGLVATWSVGFAVPFAIPCHPPPPQSNDSNDNSTLAMNSPSLDVQISNCYNTPLLEQTFVFSDLGLATVVLLSPLLMILKLRLSLLQKIAFATVLIIGGGSVAASALRAKAYIHGLMHNEFDAPVTFFMSHMNITFFWGMIEASLAVIAACLPVLKAMCGRRFNRRSVRDERSWPEPIRSKAQRQKANAIRNGEISITVLSQKMALNSTTNTSCGDSYIDVQRWTADSIRAKRAETSRPFSPDQNWRPSYETYERSWSEKEVIEELPGSTFFWDDDRPVSHKDNAWSQPDNWPLRDDDHSNETGRAL